MDTWAATTLVHLGVTVRGLKARRTLAVKSILFIHTCPPISTGAGRTLVDLHIALGTSEARFADTVIAVYAIFADTVVTWVAGTIIKIDFTICARGSMLALADVLVHQVHTLAPVLTRVAVALVELVLTAIARVAGVTVTAVAGNAIDAGAVVAWVGLTVVDITLAECAFITFSAAALEPVGPVVALRSILAGRAGALIDVDLTHGASKPWLAGACEAIDHVPTDAVIHTRVALTVIYVNLTVSPHVTWHTDAGELSNAVQASGVVLAGHGQAFVDVNLTSRAGISPAALTLEGALCVHTFTKMLTWIGTDRTLIHVLVAGTSYKAGGTCANGAAIQGVGVAHRPLVARVTHTCIIEVAQQTRLSNWALAEEGCYAVMAGGTIEANGDGAVIDVLTAVISRPTVDADTGMSPDGVEASAPIMAGIWLHETLVDILSTVLPCPLWWALAIVGVDSIHTYSSIHTFVTWTVVHVFLTVVSFKPW